MILQRKKIGIFVKNLFSFLICLILIGLVISPVSAGTSHTITDSSVYDVGIFGPASAWPGIDETGVVADLNADGIADIASSYSAGSGEVRVFFGGSSFVGDLNGDTDYNVKLDGCYPAYNSMIAGDVNGDDENDLVIGCSGSSEVYIFFSEIFQAYGVTQGNDIVLSTCSSCYSVKYSNVSLGDEDWTTYVAIEDMNGDGNTDLVLNDGDGDIPSGVPVEGVVHITFSTALDDYKGTFENDLDAT
ncbi:hypothetical protein KJ918_03475, partial [Patescibacteria group bacterium]|nr:hypothetical protein [Patescibacteria group bacterium]